MRNRANDSSIQNGSNSDEVAPLNSQDKVVAPMAEMEKADDPDMCEVDLGDGDPGAPNGRRKSATDKPNGDTTDTGPARLKPETAGKDETDAASVYSIYMDSDFRYYFQHPWARLFVAYFVTFCNFLIYAEDPVAHSRVECNIPVIGNCFAFIFTRYPSNAWSFLKVLLWLTGIIVGMLVGKIFFHTFLLNKIFRLKVFTECKGSWMIMFLSTVLCLFIFSYIYTAFLMIGGDSTSPYRISPYMGIANHYFMKAAATGTWCGDFFTAWMVTDMMLQEKLYPMWAKRVRTWWNSGLNRIILFWIAVCLCSFIVVFVIATDYIQWDKLNRDFLHSNELSRAFLASFILVMDIVIVMQDWDFPHFISAIDIKLPGVNTAHINFKIPQLLKKLEYWHVHITGKWFNYGILFFVILLDLNMWKNQIFYVPYDYGQYVDAEGRIHSVNDDYTINNLNETLVSFAYRNATVADNTTGQRYIELDNIMNARYNGYSVGLKAIAFVPCICVFITFFIFIGVYGRLPKPTKEDPYAGRLKKRKKRGFSVRLGWQRLRKRMRGTRAVLTGFKSASSDVDSRERRGAGGDEVDGTSMEEKVVNVWKHTKKEDLQGDAQAAVKSGDGPVTVETRGREGGDGDATIETVGTGNSDRHRSSAETTMI
ncbi:transmembrane protein 117-like isoform X2 [Littorina saxatilis]